MTTPGETPDPIPDAELIETYLGLPTVDAILGQLGPAPTIDEALDRPAMAKKDLAKKGQMLALQLSPEGLCSLMDQLALAHGVSNWHEDNALAEFPDAQPALAVYNQRLEEGLIADDRLQIALAEASLVKAKEILGIRWKEGPVDAREWMAAIIGDPEIGKYADKILRAWATLLRATRFRDHRAHIAPTDERFSRAVRDECESVREFVEGFFIGRPTPPPIAADVAKYFSRYWPPRKKFETDGGKAEAVQEWHRFWTNYGMEWWTTRGGNSRRKKDPVKKAAGEARANQRERARWVDFTQNFVEWAGKRPATPDLIHQFPNQDDVVLKKGRAFLKTLLTAKGSLALQHDLVDSLAADGIKLPADTGKEIAFDCYSILVKRKVLQK